MSRGPINKEQLMLISQSINETKYKISITKDNKKLQKLKDELLLFKNIESRIENGYDVDLSKNVLSYYSGSDKDKCHTISEYNQGRELREGYMYTQLSKTDIIIEYKNNSAWTELNQSCGDKSLYAQFYKVGIYQLLNKNHKQIINIPILRYPKESFEKDMISLSNHIIDFIQKEFNIKVNIKNKYLISYKDEVIDLDKYRMSYLVIYSHYFNNYNEKCMFINNFKEYLLSIDEHILIERIGYCVTHQEIPNTEIITPPMEKTINDKDMSKIRKNKNNQIEIAEISNVKDAKPMAIVMHDNTIINNNSTQNINIINGNGTVAVNTSAGTVNIASNNKVKIHHQDEYINAINTTPPEWHISGKIVSITSLYDFYISIGGTSSIQQFGMFIKKLVSNYKKSNSRIYVDKKRTSGYEIL